MNHDPLANLYVAAPCAQSWEGMHGDERVRFCDSCQLNVFNLSAMSRAEARDLIERQEGRLCVRYYQRADGTLLSRDCPVGRATLRERSRRAIAQVGALVGLVFGSLLGCTGPRPTEPRPTGPSAGDPPKSSTSGTQPVEIMGDICVEQGELEALPEPHETLGRIAIPQPQNQEQPPK